MRTGMYTLHAKVTLLKQISYGAKFRSLVNF